MQETFSDLFGSHPLNGERGDRHRCTEISPREQRENDSDPIQRDGARVSELPILLPGSSCAGWTRWISPRLHSTDIGLLCPYPSPGAKTPLTNTRVCSEWEQHVQANIHDVLSPLHQEHTLPHTDPWNSVKTCFALYCLLMLGKSHPRLAIKHTGTFHVFSRRAKMWSFSEYVAR